MRSRSRQSDLLAQLELFSASSEAELRRVHALLCRVDVAPGTVLMRQGTPGTEFLVVAQGLVSVTRDSDPPEHAAPRLVSGGEVLGEMALLHRAPRSATAVAMTPTTVYAATPQEFFALLDASPLVAARIEETAALRSRANLAA